MQLLTGHLGVVAAGAALPLPPLDRFGNLLMFVFTHSLGLVLNCEIVCWLLTFTSNMFISVVPLLAMESDSLGLLKLLSLPLSCLSSMLFSELY